MAKYDVYRNPAGSGFLIDVQSDHLMEFSTRVVIPLLIRTAKPIPVRRLTPILPVDGVDHILATQLISAVPKAILKHPIDNLRHHFAAITGAIDMLFQGF